MMGLARAVAVVALLSLAAALALQTADEHDTPSQVHMAQSDSTGLAVSISWLTRKNKSGEVHLGTTPGGPYDKEFKPDEEPASYTFINAYTGKYESGVIHHVNVTGLAYSTQYVYTVGTKEEPSKEFQFTTPPAPGPETPFIFAVIGDLGQTSNSSATVQHIMSMQPGTFGQTLLVGDLSYADSAWDPVGEGKNCSQQRWDSWGMFIEPLAATMPLMVLPGNHEVEQEGPLPATQEQFLAFQKRFRMPSGPSGATNGNLYFSFNVASAHIVMLNSYMPFNASSDQYKWLVNDFATYDRTTYPWLIVCMHAPWYNSNQHHHDEPEEVGMRAAMEQMFYDNEVDLVLAGHVHAYERMYPVFNNVTNATAPTYINIGDGGNREGPCPEYFAQPSWSAFREARFGHAALQIFNSTHMQWTWHRIIDDEKTSADNVTLVKNKALGLHPRGLTALGATTDRQHDYMPRPPVAQL